MYNSMDVLCVECFPIFFREGVCLLLLFLRREEMVNVESGTHLSSLQCDHTAFCLTRERAPTMRAVQRPVAVQRPGLVSPFVSVLRPVPSFKACAQPAFLGRRPSFFCVCGTAVIFILLFGDQSFFREKQSCCSFAPDSIC